MEKYLVASTGDTLDSKVSGRFGHSGFFLIVDPATMRYEAFRGVSNYDNQTIQEFIVTDISKVIVGNIGPSLFNEVTAYGCKIYLCRNMPVPEAIRKVKNGDIPALSEPTLKHSIHSARKTGYNYGGHGTGSIGEMPQGSGSRGRKSRERSKLPEKAQGRGWGRLR